MSLRAISGHEPRSHLEGGARRRVQEFFGTAVEREGGSRGWDTRTHNRFLIEQTDLLAVEHTVSLAHSLRGLRWRLDTPRLTVDTYSCLRRLWFLIWTSRWPATKRARRCINRNQLVFPWLFDLLYRLPETRSGRLDSKLFRKRILVTPPDSWAPFAKTHGTAECLFGGVRPGAPPEVTDLQECTRFYVGEVADQLNDRSVSLRQLLANSQTADLARSVPHYSL